MATTDHGAALPVSGEAGMHKGNEFAGKVALVTGGNRNIGRAIALSLAAGGAKVAICARSNMAEADGVVSEIAALGSEGAAYKADITDAAQVKSMVDSILSRFGGLDILVLNAASRSNTHFNDLTFEGWREIFAANVDSAFICVKATLPALKKSGDGRIITFGGITALLGTKDPHVVASKHAVVGFTKSLAHDLAEFGIRANCISPGQIQTVTAADKPKAPMMNIPLRRRGNPFEIAGMVRALCGPAGAYTTGQTIHINGGLYKSGV